MKEIPFAKRYKVTEQGEIISFKTGKPMSPVMIHNGYLRVLIKCDDGRKKSFLVHRLVAMTYLPNPDNKKEVNHKNGIKADNRPCNLEWVSRNENMRHAFSAGLNSNSGTNNGRSGLTEDQVIKIYYELLNGARSVDVSRKYDVSRRAVEGIKYKNTWGDLLDGLPDIETSTKRENLSESKVRWICKQLEQHVGVAEIANKCNGVSVHQIEGIKYRKRYKHISCDFEW